MVAVLSKVRRVACRLALVALASCAGVGWPASAADHALAWADQTLVVTPATVRLEDALARRQLLVSLAGADITHACHYESSDQHVARVDQRGFIRPAGPGQCEITVRYRAQDTVGNAIASERRAALRVEVPAFDSGRPVDFANELVPLLTRFGCNAGGCHGKATGQNGFKLSLFGFDPKFDYDAIALASHGRRIFPAAAAQSLLLRKATATVPHGGGRRIEPDSEAYQLIARWISQGAPRPAPDAPHLARLVVTPGERVMGQGAKQQLAVTADFSDGSQRDVTRQAQYASNFDLVATVDDRGLVQCGSRTGEAAIMVRYMGEVAVFQTLVPRSSATGTGESPSTLRAAETAVNASVAERGFEPHGYIDELSAAKWKKLGIRPSPPADDGQFLRRVTIDLCGRLPTIDETRSFLADSSPDKRTRLVDRLLDSADYAAYFALRWGTILRNSGRAGGNGVAFHNWLRDQIARNRPYDEFVRAIVAVSGEPAEAPPVNRYWQMRDNLVHTATSDTAQVFLGIRLQCAQCDHHPYEKWSQDDYYGLAGFFMRLATKGSAQPFILYSASDVKRAERDPRDGRLPEPRLLGGEAVKVSAEVDPRQTLVDWMVRPGNPLFAKAFVNRLWGHLFGRGLVDPIDDMRLTNPPSNPELLDALARDFVDHKYDVKHILRTIVNSGV